MLYNGIEAFLEICRSKTFSRAAEVLHLTQSSVSRRIKLLEQELGAPLIERQKGERTVYLTSFGKKFVNVADRWKILLQDTHHLTSDDHFKITIGAADSINTYVLPPLYYALYQQSIRLRIRTHHSDELYALVQNRDIDVGFVLRERVYQGVIAEPFIKEKMVIIRPGYTKSSNKQVVTPKDLDPAKELYASWSPVYDAWHDRLWNPIYARHIYIDSLPLLLTIFGKITDPSYWVILPMSIAFFLKNIFPCTIQYLSELPPDRVCYKITHLHNKADTLKRLEILNSCIQSSLVPHVQKYGTYIFTR